MTKEEAIYLLRNTAWLAPSLEPVEEAVDMATEALKVALEPVEEAVEMAVEALKRDDSDNKLHEVVLTREETVKALTYLKWLDAQNWILCSEQLPSEKGEYLVTYHPCYWDRVEPEVKVGIDTFRGKTSWAKKKYQKVIAWKPLPMPWEGEVD